jgi:hypothetical protein
MWLALGTLQEASIFRENEDGVKSKFLTDIEDRI